MKIINFRNLKEIDGFSFAEVDITYTRYKWFRRIDTTEVTNIFRSSLSGFWKYLDSGEFVPGYSCDKLYSAYKANETLKKL